MKKFKKVFVEITNVCNLACGFCPQTKRTKAFMDEKTFQKIAINIANHTEFVCLHVVGEPLLHPNLKSILKVADEMKLKINITTNGTLLLHHFNTILQSDSVKKVSFSLQSLFENNLENDKQLAILNHILNFCDQASVQGKICELRFWNKGSNTEPELKLCYERICKHFGLVPNWTDLDNKNIKLKQNIFVGLDFRFEWPGNADTMQDNIYCHALKTQVAILADGTVVPCCLDHDGTIKLGNAFNEPLEKILQTPLAQSMILGFQNRKAVCDLCKHCSFARKF